MRTRIYIMFFLVSAILGGLLADATHKLAVSDRYIAEQRDYIMRLENHVPTKRELQAKIGAEQDGIIGPNSLAKWDKAIGNQSAEKYFTQSGAPK